MMIKGPEKIKIETSQGVFEGIVREYQHDNGFLGQYTGPPKVKLELENVCKVGVPKKVPVKVVYNFDSEYTDGYIKIITLDGKFTKVEYATRLLSWDRDMYKLYSEIDKAIEEIEDELKG